MFLGKCSTCSDLRVLCATFFLSKNSRVLIGYSLRLLCATFFVKEFPGFDRQLSAKIGYKSANIRLENRQNLS